MLQLLEERELADVFARAQRGLLDALRCGEETIILAAKVPLEELEKAVDAYFLLIENEIM